MASRRLELVFTGDTAALERAFRRVDQRSRSMSGTLGRLAKAGAAAGAAMGAAFAGVGLKEAIEQEKVAARTANVLKTTGGVANVTAKQVENLAAALQKQTGTADDAIQSGANLLLTFTGIRNEVGKGNDIFNQAVAISNDLSVALGQDMSSSAIQVGKALNDPIRGVTALRRVGVSFTKDQQEQIKTLVESGRTLDAQKLILRELNVEFGNAAASEGKTTEAWQRMQRTFEDTAESVAVKLLPVFERVVSWVERNWPQIERTTRRVFAATRAAIEVAVDWIKANLVPTIQSVVRTARRFWDRFGDDVSAVFGFIGRTIKRALTVVQAIIETALAILRGDWGKAWEGVKIIVRTTFGQIIDFLRTIPRRLLSLGLEMGKALANGIKNGIISAAGAIADAIWSVVPGPLRRFLRGGAPAVSAGDLVTGIRGAGRAARAMGGTIPGRPGQAVPITAHGGEVILNPVQQRIVGIDRIVGALARTGGVIGGHGFASGGYVYPLAQKGRVIGTPYAGTHTLGNWQSDLAYDLGAPAGTKVVSPISGTVSRIQGSASQGGRFGGLGIYVSGAGGSYFLKHLGSSSVKAGQGVSAGQAIGTVGNYYGSANHVHFAASTRAALDGAIRGAVGAVTAGVRRVAGHSDNSGERLNPAQRLARALRAGGAGASAGRVARSILSAGAGDPASGVAGTSFTPSQERAIGAAGRKAGGAVLAAGGSTSEAAEAREDAERAASIKFLNKNLRDVQGLIRRLQKKRRKFFADIRATSKKKGLTQAQRRTIINNLRAARRRLKADIDALREVEKAIVDELAELRYDAQLDAAEDEGTGGAEGGEGPPTERDFIDADLAQAALTEGAGDDIAAAERLVDLDQRELTAAIASGDPRRISAAARQLAQDQAMLEALKQNTDAVNANTDQLKQSFGGSVAFSYRGQPYVLRSLAPPSSDRLVGAEVGV